MSGGIDITASDFTNFNLVKTCGPRLPSGLIERGKLDASFATLSRVRLAIVRAPAGSGKTSLLLQWRARLITEGAHLVWLSLDAEDDDPWSFFRYLGLALLQCGLPRFDPLKADYEVPPHAVGAQSQVAHMLQILAQGSEEVFVFLDDFHHISDDRILHALAALLQGLPPNLHVVAASRTAPKIPLTKLRAAGEVLEIDYPALRFSAEECEEFCRKSEYLLARGPDLSRLTLLTQGWAAGLRLLEIALRNRRLADLPFEDLARNKNVQDYLLETVLDGLPSDLLSFLTQTAVLNRLCGGLCDAVTGQGGSQRLIEEIERQGLFLSALDDHRGWYAYHPLFAEMLRQRLISHEPGMLLSLHRRAADWFMSQGGEDEALLHALAARDDEMAAGLIERSFVSIDALAFRNFDQILAWRRRLPDDFIRSHPKLHLILAFHCLVKVNWREAAALLQAVTDEDALRDFATDLLGMRSIVAYYAVDLDTAIQAAEAFLARREGAQVPGLEKAVIDHLSGAYCLAGRMADADRLLARLQRAASQVPLSYVEAQRQKIVFLFDGYFRGNIKDGVEQVAEVMKSLCARHLMESQMGSVTAILLVIGLYEMGETARVRDLLEDWSDVIERHAISTVFAGLHRLWTRILTEQKGIAAGLEHVNRVIDASQEQQQGPTTTLLLLEKARLLLRRGDLPAARTIVRRLEAGEGESFMTLGAPWAACAPVHLGVQAALLMAEARWDEIGPLLNPVIRNLQDKGLLLGLWSLKAMLIAADYGRGDPGAQERLRALLAEAEPSGVMRSIVDHGGALREPLAALLEEARAGAGVSGGPSLAYLERLAAASELAGNGPVVTPVRQAKGADTDLKLSAREIDVLKAVAAGLTNKEIARALNLGAETVKWHVRNILGKMEVDSRRRAVAKARQLNIL